LYVNLKYSYNRYFDYGIGEIGFLSYKYANLYVTRWKFSNLQCLVIDCVEQVQACGTLVRLFSYAKMQFFKITVLHG